MTRTNVYGNSLVRVSSVCFECNRPGQERHHVVPRSLGGTQTVWLCHECHGKAHHMRRSNVRQLTKEGLERAKAKGVKIGRSSTMPSDVEQRILELRREGLALRAIAERLEEEGIRPTNGGKRFYASTIKAVLNRLSRSAE